MKWLIALLAFVACTAQAQAPAVPADEAARQILVLLHMPPAHFRPDRDYAGQYGDRAGRAARQRIAAELARAHGLALVTDWPMPLLSVDCYVMRLPAARDEPLAGVLAALERDPRVAWAQPMNSYAAQGAAAHDDPLYAVQPAAASWHLAELHKRATGRHVSVAVIDSAVELAHPDLDGQIALSENFVAPPAAAETHGTGVAGIIAARADNHLGIAGIAPGAQLMALRACWQTPAQATRCNSLSLAQALHFAIAHQAQVINLSLSGPPDRLLQQLLDLALARGISVVAAVDRAQADGGFPASQPGVIAVVDDAPGAAPAGAVAAPGHDVPTTQPGARWAMVAGSSYAAAHVAGLVALVREFAPPRAVGAAAVVRMPTGGIDACATLARFAGPCACSCTATAGGQPAIARE